MALAQGLAMRAMPHAELHFTSHLCHEPSWGRDCRSTVGCPFSRSVWCVWARHSSERQVSLDPTSDKKIMREKLWREFFSDPSQWWDNRSEKVNPRYPDFKHKTTGFGLWLDYGLTPPWVEAELATMAPGLLQSHIFSWHVRLRRHVEAGEYEKTLILFQQMLREGMMLDKFTFVPVLNACSNLKSLQEGRRAHKQIVLSGCESDIYVANSLVDMYAKCGSIEDAWRVFNKTRERTVVSWNAMIGGYVKADQGRMALELYRKMHQEGVEPNTITFVGALTACASVRAVEEGRRVHGQLIQRGCESNVKVATCLVDMYAKCGSIEDAWSVFDKMRQRTVVSWNAMIVGYVKAEQGLKALELFWIMQQEGVEPDAFTFVGALNACSSVVALEEGRRVHEQIIPRGCEYEIYVASCLVDMYAKCGSIEDARSVFNKMTERNLVSWNAMIGGYAMHGHSRKAIELFKRMGKEVVDMDEITFICLLSACSHGLLVKEGLRYFNTMTPHYKVLPVREHYACMVDLLGRAGHLEEAEEMTKWVPTDRDSWMSLLGACRIHGNIEMAERVGKWCLKLYPENASVHVLLSNIYAAAGKRGRGAANELERLKRYARKEPSRTWITVKNAVHSFLVVDEENPRLWQIHAELESLSVKMNEEGYIPDTMFLSCEEIEECHLCHHSENLAIAHGSSSPCLGKNLWMS